MNYLTLKYVVENHRDLSHDQAMRIWKTMYKTFDEFIKAVIIHEGMQDFANHCANVWKDFKPVTVTEAFKEKNLEIRRLYFKAIGIENIFRELTPTLVSKTVLKFKNVRYDADNNPYTEMINDAYELYKIEGDKLFPEESSPWRRENADTYAVRCWCTTTGREYWIYVPRWVGSKNDAIEAIAWTMRINITDPEYIVRQGDILIAKASATSKKLDPGKFHHLDKKQYLKLLRTAT